MQTAYLIVPLNEGCENWLKENIAEGGIWVGSSIAVEHRFIEDIINGLSQHGLKEGVDFQVKN